MMAEGLQVWSSLTDEEREVFRKATDGMMSSETNRFRLSPTMSYVSKETRASDPGFWMPRKRPAKRATP
jgi:hypothetical protein